jgi:transketolase
MKEDASTCQSIRREILEMASRGKGGHLGSSLSLVEILYTLYFKVLRIDPLHPTDPERDRFILSSCQGAMAYYSVLARRGFFAREWLAAFLDRECPLTMFPTVNSIPGVEMTGGSLGHGVAFAVGLCLHAKRQHLPWRSFVVVGDGEFDEGTMWESLLAASHFQLDNLTVIVNRNRMQIDGSTESVMALEPFAAKLKAFGCGTIEVDGHDVTALEDILPKTTATGPQVVIARTTKGKGVSFMENSVEWHYRTPNCREMELALGELKLIAPGGSASSV